jgi:hypothetical protein
MMLIQCLVLMAKEGTFFIGDSEIAFGGDDIIIGDRVYEGTLYYGSSLLVRHQAMKYIQLMIWRIISISLQALMHCKRNNNPNEMHPKSNGSPRWLNLLKPIWNKSYSRQHTGSLKGNCSLPFPRGFSRSNVEHIILPSDPMALLDRLDLLLASHKAGETQELEIR